MENFRLFMKKKRRRCIRDFVLFFDALSLFLEVGYDLSFSWAQVLRALEGQLDCGVSEILDPKVNQGDGVGAVLSRLMENSPLVESRVWFSVLKELYESGAGVLQGVVAFTAALRTDYQRELEEHCRNLPTKLNILMLLFFLPAALFLMFAPLVSGITQNFVK